MKSYEEMVNTTRYWEERLASLDEEKAGTDFKIVLRWENAAG